MDYRDQRFQELARLQIRLGAAVQKGQRLHIKGMPVSCAWYAKVLAHEAYRAGAANVEVFWQDADITRLRVLYAQDEALEDWYGPDEAAWERMAQRGDCELVFFGSDPHALDGCDAQRVHHEGMIGQKMTRPIMQAHCNKSIRVCTTALPTAAWAKDVFPELTEEKALDALWEAVFASMRVTGDGEAGARWDVFTRQTKTRCDKLNRAELIQLHYQNSLGTDVRIGLPEGCRWNSAKEQSTDGISYFSNLPTEEVYTSPHRDRADGAIVSSMPLYWMGSVIDGLRFTMKDGKVVEAEAKIGNELLQKLLSTDEGALHLGECALISWDSSIRSTGVAFHNMLFDENAACHFALGLGFADAVEGRDMQRAGINQSKLHMDFMIGTGDLNVSGTKKDGREVPILRNGCWAMEDEK